MKVGWEARKQKLLVLMLLADEIAEELSAKAGEAFFRAFIVEDRQTGAITCNFRFRYEHGDSWYAIVASDKGSRAETVADLEEGMQTVILTAVEKKVGVKPPKEIMKSFYAPDDGGDPEKTVQWLIEKDLVQITKIEEEVDDRINGESAERGA